MKLLTMVTKENLVFNWLLEHSDDRFESIKLGESNSFASVITFRCQKKEARWKTVKKPKDLKP